MIVSQLASNDILGVWRDPVTGKKVFTTRKEERPKPKYREMSLVNPNQRAVIREIVEDSGADGLYYIDVSEWHGNGQSSFHMTWPEIYACQINREDRDGMRLKEIAFS